MTARRPVSRRLARWIDARIGAANFSRTALRKVFPDHWSFLFGEIPLYSFVVLVLTGVFLTFFFEPSLAETVYTGSYWPLRGVEMSRAYHSVLELSFDVRAGLVMRQIHHWAAVVFAASIVVHLVRVFFTGAFRRPRELNWMVGVTLLILAIVNGFTGYSLVDDQLSGTGLRIAYGVVLSIPAAGTWMASLLFGGEFPGPDILQRLYVLHVLVVPVAIGSLVAVHLFMVVRHKHSHFPGPGRFEDNVVGEIAWPTYAAKAGGLFFITAGVLAALGGLAQINPIWIYGPFRPADVSAASQPDWYMAWLDGALRIFPPWELRAFGYEIPNPFYPGVLLPGITFGLLYLWPLLEARLTGDRDEHHLLDRPHDRPLRTAFGVATLVFYAVLTVAAATDVLSTTFGFSINAAFWLLRVTVIVLPLAAGYFTYRLARDMKARENRSLSPGGGSAH